MCFQSEAAYSGRGWKRGIEVRAVGVWESFRQEADIGSNRFCRLFETTCSPSARPDSAPEAKQQFRNR
jgi:hypothetical protein